MFIAPSALLACSILNFTQLLPFRATDTNAEFIGTVAELYKVYMAWTVCTFMTCRLIHESICYTLREEEPKPTKGGGILSGENLKNCIRCT